MFTFLVLFVLLLLFQGRKVKIKKVQTAFQKPTPLTLSTGQSGPGLAYIS
jgi:hypothetical protein